MKKWAITIVAIIALVVLAVTAHGWVPRVVSLALTKKDQVDAVSKLAEFVSKIATWLAAAAAFVYRLWKERKDKSKSMPAISADHGQAGHDVNVAGGDVKIGGVHLGGDGSTSIAGSVTGRDVITVSEVQAGGTRITHQTNIYQQAAVPELAGLIEAIKRSGAKIPVPVDIGNRELRIPSAPSFFAMPPYTPGHPFVGRLKEIQLLSKWAAKPDEPVLVFQAIGGMGKSMICWEWVTQHCQSIRPDFAGVFWYSFYERGADMSDFCAYALAYISGRPAELFKGQKTAALASELFQFLRQRPWLLVLDGLERILVAYNRYDAAQVRDEEVETWRGTLRKQIAHDCIREADSDLLRTLAEASPSKFLISSRLMPSALLNVSDVARPGVVHQVLNGLEPHDAVVMLRKANIRGDSAHMQHYLDKAFGCHPLVVGVVGGLIRNYPPAPGDFEQWSKDPLAGASVNPAAMDLVQRRNHILRAAFEDLPPDEGVLLTRIALVSEAVEYPTLMVLSPRHPDLPRKVEPPPPPGKWLTEHPELYKELKAKYENYQEQMDVWRESALSGERWSRGAVEDLRSRGLLQWDEENSRYDLHPVVRGYAVSSIAPDRRLGVAQRVVDHFSSRPRLQYDDARTINDLRDPLQVARTLLYIGKFEEAARLTLDLASALVWNLEAYAEYLALAQPLFPDSWTEEPSVMYPSQLSRMWTYVAIALEYSGPMESDKSISDADWIYEHVVELDIRLGRFVWMLTDLRNFAMFRARCGRLKSAAHLSDLLFTATAVWGDEESKALERLWKFMFSVQRGDFKEAQTCWEQFETHRRPKTRNIYRPGNAEYYLALFRFYENQLDNDFLEASEQVARDGANRLRVRDLYRLRGEWHMSLGHWAEASVAFQEEIRMSREVGIESSGSEARLAIAQTHIGQKEAARDAANRLAELPGPPHLELAELYLALGEHSKAGQHAISAHNSAWADGPPYACWRELQRCRKVLKTLGIAEPSAPFRQMESETFIFELQLQASLRDEEERREKEHKKLLAKLQATQQIAASHSSPPASKP